VKDFGLQAQVTNKQIKKISGDQEVFGLNMTFTHFESDSD
jgi:hypothetical protein